jgi:hypothetical protein
MRPDPALEELTRSFDEVKISTPAAAPKPKANEPPHCVKSEQFELLLFKNSPLVADSVNAWSTDVPGIIAGLFPPELGGALTVDSTNFRQNPAFILNFPDRKTRDMAQVWMMDVDRANLSPRFIFMLPREDKLPQNDTRRLLLRNVHAISAEDAAEAARGTICKLLARAEHMAIEPKVHGDAFVPKRTRSTLKGPATKFNVFVTCRSEQIARSAFDLLEELCISSDGFAARFPQDHSPPVSVQANWKINQCNRCSRTLQTGVSCNCSYRTISIENAHENICSRFLYNAKIYLKASKAEHGSSMRGAGKVARQRWATFIIPNTPTLIATRFFTAARAGGQITDWFVGESIADLHLFRCNACGQRSIVCRGELHVRPHAAGDKDRCPRHHEQRRQKRQRRLRGSTASTSPRAAQPAARRTPLHKATTAKAPTPLLPACWT